MKGIFTILLILVYPSLVCSQLLRQPIAAHYMKAGAYSTQHQDVFSFTANQAALARLKKASGGVYGERRFMLNELSNYSAVAGIITGSGNFGVQANYFGFSDFNQTQIGLAYGRKLGEKMDIGAQFNYHGISAKGYGTASAISFELGIILHLTEKLNAGVHINNPVGGKFGIENQEKLPSIYTVGLGYDASEKLYLSFEINKEENMPVNIIAGLQYEFVKQFRVKLGIASASSAAWLGAGVLFKNFRVDITAAYHPQLGLTPDLLFIVEFNKK